MTPKVWKKLRAGLLIAAIPGLLGLALVHWPVTAGLERTYGLDLLVKLRGKLPTPPGVCVVAIDDTSYLERDLDVLQPWPRALHGELVMKLKEQGARAVAFDVLFEGAGDPAQDVQFELGLFDAGNVVLGSTIDRVADPRFRQVRMIEPHTPFAESAAAVGEVELPAGTDGVIREAWLMLDERPSLALAAYQVATGDDSYDAERGTRLIDFYGPPRTIETVSLYQALDPEQYLPADFFRDRIVFVGASQVAAVAVTEAKDSFSTPFSGGEVGRTFGVEIHATIAANLLENRKIGRLSRSVESILLVALAMLASLVFIYLRPVVGAVVLFFFIIAAWLAGFFAFTRFGLLIPVVIPGAIQLPVAYGASLVWYYLTTVREREKIRRAFSFYLSPEMIRKIQESSEAVSLGGEEIVATAVFSDIKGFTSIAEKMTATNTASMLNDYFSEITRKLFETGGTLIKYIGDAVFAIWGAPVRMDDHATQACRAAVAMGQAFKRTDGGDELITRVGVHTGSMLVGNLGSAQRFDYTAIGDTINLAARLESLNKSTGTRILASGETIDRTDGEIATRYIGRVRVVGKAEPVVLYELLGLQGDETHPDTATVEIFERSVEEFTAGKLSEAEAGFRDVRERCGGEDGPSELYLRTIEELGSQPPAEGWDGVINFTKK